METRLPSRIAAQTAQKKPGERKSAIMQLKKAIHEDRVTAGKR